MIAMTIDRPWQHDARILRIAHLGDVGSGVGRVADQRQPQRRVHPLKGAAHHQRIILRLKPRHIKEITPALEPERFQRPARGNIAHRSAVGDERGIGSIARAVVCPDVLGIGYDRGRAYRRKRFRHQIPGARGHVPLLPLPFQAIHVDCRRQASHARQGGEDGVGAIAVKHGVEIRPVAQEMQRRTERVSDRLGVFVAHRREVDKPHTPVCLLAMLFAAIDRHLMAAFDQTNRQFLGECLEAAIAGRDTACA